VHLDTDVQRRPVGGPLPRQALGQLGSVDAVHPVEALGHSRGLVGLQRADEMPARLRWCEGVHLAERLLQEVLAEILQPGRQRRPHGRHRLPLAYPDDAYRLRVAPGSQRRGGHPRPDGRQPFRHAAF
jgi:hypothetical protein